MNDNIMNTIGEIKEIRQIKRFEKTLRVHLERNEFIEACGNHIEKVKALTEANNLFLEEAMIRLEESVVNKAKVLAIQALTVELPDLQTRLSRVEETRATLNLLEKVRQTELPDDATALQVLRTRMMDLSFLPVVEQTLAYEPLSRTA